MRQNRIARAVAPAGARAPRGGVAAALAAMPLAGCGARLRSSNGGIGPYPENYEALVRDFVDERPVPPPLVPDRLGVGSPCPGP